MQPSWRTGRRYVMCMGADRHDWETSTSPHAAPPALLVCRAAARRTRCWGRCRAPRSAAWCRALWRRWREALLASPTASSRWVLGGRASGCCRGRAGAASLPAPWPLAPLHPPLPPGHAVCCGDLLRADQRPAATQQGQPCERRRPAAARRCHTWLRRVPLTSLLPWLRRVLLTSLLPSPRPQQVVQDPARGITVAEVQEGTRRAGFEAGWVHVEQGSGHPCPTLRLLPRPACQATELPVSSERDCVELMQLSIANRAVSATGEPPAGLRLRWRACEGARCHRSRRLRPAPQP